MTHILMKSVETVHNMVGIRTKCRSYRYAEKFNLKAKASAFALCVALSVGVSHPSFAQVEQDSVWDDLFYIGLVDVTLGRRTDGLEEATDSNYQKTIKQGRVALYLKGKVKGSTLITAALDTGESDLSNIFKDLDKKTTQAFIDRIKPDDYYPIYGDDSTITNTVQTAGKLFIKVERDDSHAVWGTFKSGISGSKYVGNNRSFYGAQGVYKSNAKTKSGKNRIGLTVYGAQVSTLPQRDEFLGTGGSVYFLRRQDISRGSEEIEIIRYNPITGNRTTVKTLQYGRDYDINPAQGIVTLNAPLDQNPTSDSLITGDFGEDELRLVVNYNYSPTISDISNISYAGRAEAWVSDNILIGATGLRDNNGNADQRISEVDLLYKLGKKSNIKVEYARSSGTSNVSTFSDDAGVTRTIIPGKTGSGQAARADVKLDLEELGFGVKGNFSGYFERRSAGFASLSTNTEHSERLFGASIAAPLSDRTKIKFGVDRFSNSAGVVRTKYDAKIDYKLVSERTDVSIGIAQVRQDHSLSASEIGSRTDVAVKVKYKLTDKTSVYAKGQRTINTTGGFSDNDRYALGASTRLSEKMRLKGEISTGTTGLGAKARLSYYDKDTRTTAYTGYTLDPNFKEDDASGKSSYVLGASRAINDDFSMKTENGYDLYGSKRALKNTVGTTYRLSDTTKLKASFTYSTITNSATTATIKRNAFSLGADYKKDDLIINAGFEYRVDGDDSSTTTDEGKRFISAKVVTRYKLSESARILASLKGAVTNNDDITVHDGRYLSGLLGYAYRPVSNDRLNILTQYRYLYDGTHRSNSGSGTFDGQAQQISHVLGVDVTYDLNQKFTLGAKIAGRKGRIKSNTPGSGFISNNQTLYAANLRYHLVHNWDALLEVRQRSLLGVSKNTGTLIRIDRHVGRNFKLGFGYNFGTFSDDLNDNTYNNRGMFINLVGKF